MTTLGLQQLIADTADGYIQAVQQLAADLPALAEMRARLRDRMRGSRLCDGRGWTRGLETAYEEMWQARRAETPR